RRLSRPARQVWRFGKAFASTGAERTKVREHPRAAKTKPKPKIAGRAGSLRYRGWTIPTWSMRSAALHMKRATLRACDRSMCTRLLDTDILSEVTRVR